MARIEDIARMLLDDMMDGLLSGSFDRHSALTAVSLPAPLPASASLAAEAPVAADLDILFQDEVYDAQDELALLA